MSMFELYLITMLPNFAVGLLAVSLFVGCVYLFAALFVLFEGSLFEIKSRYKVGVPVFVLASWLVVGLIPSHEQLAFIVGAEWATNNEDLREVPDNVAKVINGYLEELGSEIGEK